jgi:hypothetical protein
MASPVASLRNVHVPWVFIGGKVRAHSGHAGRGFIREGCLSGGKDFPYR